MGAHIAVPHGVAVLDIYDGRWALWQVSANSATGPMRASSTNAIVTDGFDAAAFDCVSYNRPVLLSERALIACDEQRVLDSARMKPEVFLQDCESWVSSLQQIFWDENDRRLAHNIQVSEARKAAKAEGALVPEMKRLAPLQDIDWPAPPPSSAWESDSGCTKPASEEALRIARGCIRLLNYWLDIESDRTRKNRSYFHSVDNAIRPWPSPASKPGNGQLIDGSPSESLLGPLPPLASTVAPSDRETSLMSLSFTAIDFETANARRGSICSVGLAKVINGVVTASTSWLIKPPGEGGFDDFNTGIHGITAHDVRDAPDWPSSLSRILDFIDGDIVVAHNAAFDAGALREACDFAGLAWPIIDYTCTLVMSRALLDLPAYKLPWVAEALAIQSFDHHEAGADATAAALIAVALAEANGAITIQDLVAHAGVKLGRIDPDSWSGSRKASKPARARLDLDGLEIEPNGPMAGEVVCFTGKISWVREDAQAMVVRHGGSISTKPTKNTTILVTGDFDERTFRPGMKYSSSLAKAFALVDGGQTLEIMTEADFRQKLEPEDGIREHSVRSVSGIAI